MSTKRKRIAQLTLALVVLFFLVYVNTAGSLVAGKIQLVHGPLSEFSPLTNVLVRFHGSPGNRVGVTRTGPGGFFLVVLPRGSYTVEFVAPPETLGGAWRNPGAAPGFVAESAWTPLNLTLQQRTGLLVR
jgi:hypothetical protein